MLNFRKLKQDFASMILKEGKELHDKKKVTAAKILRLDKDSIRFSGKIVGNFGNTYESEIEIDRFESEVIHSNCDCSYRYDCQHLAALLFHLEEHLDSILVDYSHESDLATSTDLEVEQKQELLEKIEIAKNNEVVKKDKKYQKELLEEYVTAASCLASSPFFLPKEEKELQTAELAIILNPASLFPGEKKRNIDFQLALRLPSRSKPLTLPLMKQFLEAVKNEEPIFVSGKKYLFSQNSFDPLAQKFLRTILSDALFPDISKNEKAGRIAQLSLEALGEMIASVFERVKANRGFADLREGPTTTLPYLFLDNLENPLQCSLSSAIMRFELDFLQPPAAKILLNPKIVVDQVVINSEESLLFQCSKPGLLHKDTYYCFQPHVKRMHLINFNLMRDLIIPEPLFGTFVENSLPQLRQFAEVVNEKMVEKFVTLPFVGKLSARCNLSYLNGELEAVLHFSYDGIEVPAVFDKLEFKHINSFITKDGVLARNLVEERKIIEELFQDFIFNSEEGCYVAKSEKKIVEFMTEIIPKNQDKVAFECPQNLLDQFIYDQTTFKLSLDYKDKVGYFELSLDVKGELKGVKLDLLWECMSSKKAYIELPGEKRRVKGEGGGQLSKILVLDLERLSRVIQIFDELGIKKLDTFKEDRPLWSLATIDEVIFQGLPVKFSMTEKLEEIKRQMLGEKELVPSPIPKNVKAEVRPYQQEGVHWLEKLRRMYLNGILADDMGLGKTLQAIIALTQSSEKSKSPSLVVCPTSLLYNWKEELNKFNGNLNVMIIDGVPLQRKKRIESAKSNEIFITSYSLLQKDIELYTNINFNYAILDEAQHIKNRGTRNAKSVKMIRATHRLILTGTPIENSLDELWSLFDFLMPGFLSGYERFCEKYIRTSGENYTKGIEYLKKKVSPFILRRMKSDVLSELPPVAEMVYHCHLGDNQEQLYKSYAKSAKDELIKLVEKEGFEKVQIHVLATLTRLKQICCHPAIFAKESAEEGDSAKYDLLLELLETLMKGKHRTVIFSQYTKMLQIMKEDFEQRGISFAYLDGTSKNRLQIVKEFNENESIPVFLVSLKAGGTGLNITGADTVIHYDMWWNPAVESQATDRVHRIGQKKSVSAYKLVTLGSIEEKIVEMQKRKQGLVKKVVSCDDEALSKLTWEEVLELLQT